MTPISPACVGKASVEATPEQEACHGLGDRPLRKPQTGKLPPPPFGRREKDPPPPPLSQHSRSTSSPPFLEPVLFSPPLHSLMRSCLSFTSHPICSSSPGTQGHRNLQKYLFSISKLGSWSSSSNYHSQFITSRRASHLGHSLIRCISSSPPTPFHLTAPITNTQPTSPILCPPASFDAMKGTTPSPSPVPKVSPRSKSSASPVSGTKRKRADDGAKFYAVKVGFKPGVYYNWPDCLAQITGYKKAICELKSNSIL